MKCLSYLLLINTLYIWRLINNENISLWNMIHKLGNMNQLLGNARPITRKYKTNS